MAASACATCGAKRNHSVHLRAVAGAGYHAFTDASRAGLRAVSEGRQAYLDSEAHRDAYAAAAAPTCLMARLDEVGPCGGPLTKHHTAPRGRSGGLAASERSAPVITLCAAHNDYLTQTSEGQRWGVSHTFERGGVQHPYLVSRKAP